MELLVYSLSNTKVRSMRAAHQMIMTGHGVILPDSDSTGDCGENALEVSCVIEEIKFLSSE